MDSPPCAPFFAASSGQGAAPAAPPPPPPPQGLAARVSGIVKERSRATLAVLAVSRRARTIAGFGFIIAGLLASIASMTLDSGAADLTGRFGVLSTHVLFGLFGKAAYLFGPALIWSGFRGLARDDWSAYLSGLLGNLSVAWAVSVFFRLSGPTPAGIAGEYLAMLLEFFTGRTGAYLINGLLMFTGVLLLLQIPFEDVKQKIVAWLEGTETDPNATQHRGSSWVSRLLVFIPLATIGFALWRRLRAGAAPAGNADTPLPPASSPASSIPSTMQPSIPSSVQPSSGGIPVLDRLVSRKESSSVPPWIERVEELDEMAESADPTLPEGAFTDALAQTRVGENPLSRTVDEQLQQIEGLADARSRGVRNSHRHVWRPGVGFVDEPTGDGGDGGEEGDRRADNMLEDALLSRTEGLIIEEEDFPFPGRTRSDGSGDPDFGSASELPLRSGASRHRDPSIIYDPERNRYLFRRRSEPSLATAGPTVEYLDEMELHLPHGRWTPRLRQEGIRESLREGAGTHAAWDGERADQGEPEVTVLAARPVAESAPASAQGSDTPDAQGFSNDIDQDDVMDAPHATDVTAAPHYADVADATDATDQSGAPPSSAMLFPVVFADGRYSRYRLQRRVAKQSPRVESEDPEAEMRDITAKLEKVMGDFGVQAKVTGAVRGPMITLYEVRPEAGVRVNRFHGIQDEIRMNLAAFSVRIVAPIPGKSTIGVELPNRVRQFVSMGDLVNGDPDFSSSKRELSIALGKDIGGVNRYLDLTRLPHILIAGATGSGKSVFMNSVIASLLFNHSPDEVRFLMIDPKMVELKLFEGIPHLLHPVITDVRLADRALNWAVQEMESRYQLLSNVKCRDIRSYNTRIAAGELQGPRLPYIVLLIDELSDLMMVSAKEVEDSIIRLTQKARAVGIHVIMATQRPSVDVITSLIKANCPARISFQVAQKIDSRIILDTNGAESLLGKGDMLYKSPTAAELVRIQSPMISEQEIEEIVQEACRYGTPRYIDLPGRDEEAGSSDDAGDVDQVLVDAAWEIILESGKTSTSYVQRRLRIGYNRAATIIERLEQMGYLGPAIGNRPREIVKGRS